MKTKQNKKLKLEKFKVLKLNSFEKKSIKGGEGSDFCASDNSSGVVIGGVLR